MSRLRWILIAVALSIGAPSLAVQPDEILPDPALEQRARNLSQGLRCLVCRNENIDESHADLARDLRLLVRERLSAGDSDAQVIDYIVDRYGEYVLLMPRGDGVNLILWLAGPAMALGAAAIALMYQRKRRLEGEETPVALDEAEAARLREILES